MEFLTDLWLPILVASVLVFIASAVIWMAMPHRRKEFQKLPNEQGAIDAIAGAPAGQYMAPYCDHSSMKDPEQRTRYMEGPAGLIVVFPHPRRSMGLCMALSFVVYLIISSVVAYIARHALVDGASYLRVFQLVGATAFAAYSLGGISNVIWFQKPYKMIINDIIDGLVYGLLTAGAFASMWP
ncbi:MAG: hypothetical protein H6811_02295 [Phycisphaeraceae bacterium]|nr:hypothetical protein [Phycisphaeraceae bacterium]